MLIGCMLGGEEVAHIIVGERRERYGRLTVDRLRWRARRWEETTEYIYICRRSGSRERRFELLLDPTTMSRREGSSAADRRSNKQKSGFRPSPAGGRRFRVSDQPETIFLINDRS